MHGLKTAALALALCANAVLGESSEVGIKYSNDFFVWDDGGYTHGIEIYLAPENSGFSYLIGQEIHTPQDISASVPKDGERPYGAVLYAGAEYRGEYGPFYPVLGFRAGTVGKSALGEQTQNLWHETFNDREPKGWDTQVGGKGLWELRLRGAFAPAVFGVQSGPWKADIAPFFDAALGNCRTHGALGGEVRVGRNIPKPNAIKDGSDKLYLYFGVQRVRVFEEYLLENDREGYFVEPLRYFNEAKAGFVYGEEKYDIGFELTKRGIEFEGQGEKEIFGTLTLRLRF